MKKPKERKGKIIFINAVNELRTERNNAWLEPKNIQRISDAYWKFKDEEGFSKIEDIKNVLSEANNGNLSLPLYVKQLKNNSEHDLEELIKDVSIGHTAITNSINSLLKKLQDTGIKVK